MSEVSNYEVTKKNTAKLFMERDQEEIIRRCGLTADDASIFVMFFGRRYRVDRRTGVILRDWKEKTKQKHECMPYSAGGLDSARQEEADFEEAMTIYDYLCDSRPGCHPSGDFVTSQSLQRVVTSRIGEGMFTEYAAFFEQNEALVRVNCEQIGGISAGKGDISYDFSMFGELKLRISFWRSDEDFPASLQVFWDQNVLDYIRFETTYYAVFCVLRRICGREV